MCEVLDKIEKKGRAEGRAEGEMLGKIKMCKEFGLNAQQIAERLNIAISVVQDVLAGKTVF